MILSINILYISNYLDINECSKDLKICSNLTNSYCFNFNGNYDCKCNAGYVKMKDTCEGYNITQYLYIIFYLLYNIIIQYVSIILFFSIVLF